jgi:hypothetical protein
LLHERKREVLVVVKVVKDVGIPAVLDAEGLAESPDVARNVLVELDLAVDEQGWDRKTPSARGSRRVAVFTADFRVVVARAKTATGSRRAGGTVAATFVVGHVAANAWDVNASAASGEGKSAQVVVPVVALAGPRSAQIRGAVSVHQGSLIRKARLYVRRACMYVVCCVENCTGMLTSTVETQSRRMQCVSVKAIASGVHSAGHP